jgi:hypothetical protein
MCGPGFFLSNCTALRDASCAACETTVAGPLNWTDNCGFACADGFTLQGSECVSEAPVVVHTVWDADQTASLMGALCVCTTVVVATWGGVIKASVIRLQARPRMPRMPRIELRKRV